ncbi:MAG: hypothetical protein JXR91_00295 [Deltaproteobacteria bacterium]|nr:hypothetical protein [Deltaproteobacteria bacterium]
MKFFLKTGPTIRNSLFKHRFTLALLVSIAAHSTIFYFISPDYTEVKDRAIEFDIVEGDSLQPLAPEAQGPRSLEQLDEITDALDEKINPDVPDEDQPLEGAIIEEDSDKDNKGEKTGDSDSSKDSDSDIDSDTAIDSDTVKDSDTSKDTDKISDSDSEKKLDSEKDTGSDSDTLLDDKIVKAGVDSTDTDTHIADSDSLQGVSRSANNDSDSEKKGAAENEICFHELFSFGKLNPDWSLWMSMSAFAGTRYEQGLAGVLNSFYLYNQMVKDTGINPLTELEGVLISADDFSDFSSYQVVTTYNIAGEEIRERLKKSNASKPGFTFEKTSWGFSGKLPNSYRWDFTGSGRVMVASDAAKGKGDPEWPKDVTCMRPRPKFKGDPAKIFNTLVRSLIGPDDENRWPVLVLGTRDPNAAGLYRYPNLAKVFKWAVVKGFFSDPIRITGEVQFDGTKEDMAEVERVVKILLAQGEGRWVKLSGLGNISKRVTYSIKGNALYFTIPLTEAEVHISLILLKSYSQMINDKFKK